MMLLALLLSPRPGPWAQVSSTLRPQAVNQFDYSKDANYSLSRPTFPFLEHPDL